MFRSLAVLYTVGMCDLYRRDFNNVQIDISECLNYIVKLHTLTKSEVQVAAEARVASGPTWSRRLHRRGGDVMTATQVHVVT